MSVLTNSYLSYSVLDAPACFSGESADFVRGLINEVALLVGYPQFLL